MAQSIAFQENRYNGAIISLTIEDPVYIVARTKRRGLASASTLTSPTQPNPIPVKKKGLDHAR
jgi:hypothetical protein